MQRTASLLVLASLAALSTACDERANAGTLDAGAAPTAPPTTSASARPAPSTSSSAAPEKAPLELLKAVFTSDVKNKEPVDKLDQALPGQRVYLHLALRNRGADVRPITIQFRVNGGQRSKVDLKVEPSWKFRTWGYNTLRDDDRAGELTAEVRDDTGAVITTARLPIRNTEGPKPLPQKSDPFLD